jgi:cytochrome c oxidase cbb3-type subunit III
MKYRPAPVIAAIVALGTWLTCPACSSSPGVYRSEPAAVSPSDVVDFKQLYAQNCAGCHGADGQGGAAIALANPVFLAIADDTVIRRIASNGVTGTPMPAFAQSAGGILTEKQIDAIVRGIRSWQEPDRFREATLPPFTAQHPGDVKRGLDAYRTYCSSCHGADSHGGRNASSILDGSYLALVSDQLLRTVVIAGRPELGAPDWRGDVEGKPMSSQDISDVVAWLSSQRSKFPGQPYPAAASPAQGGIQ